MKPFLLKTKVLNLNGWRFPKINETKRFFSYFLVFLFVQLLFSLLETKEKVVNSQIKINKKLTDSFILRKHFRTFIPLTNLPKEVSISNYSGDITIQSWLHGKDNLSGELIVEIPNSSMKKITIYEEELILIPKVQLKKISNTKEVLRKNYEIIF